MDDFNRLYNKYTERVQLIIDNLEEYYNELNSNPHLIAHIAYISEKIVDGEASILHNAELIKKMNDVIVGTEYIVNSDKQEVVKTDSIRKRFTKTFDNKLREIYGDKLGGEMRSIRRMYLASTVFDVTAGVTAGVVFGKTVVAGVTIGASTFLISSVVTQSVMDKVVKDRLKKINQ